jgi:RHS repeat-associated protein
MQYSRRFHPMKTTTRVLGANAAWLIAAACLLGHGTASAGCWPDELEASVVHCASPTAAWTTPTNNFVVPTGVVTTLTAQAGIAAEDQSGSTLVRVEFFDGSTLIGSVNAPAGSYSYTASMQWTPTAGSHTLWVRAVDTGGGSFPGHPAGVMNGTKVGISGRANTAPSVSLTAPSPGSVVAGPSGTLSLAATASDADGSVARVEFYANGSLIAADTAAPYAHTWSGVSPGTYAITAKVIDNDGTAATSSAASVRVNAAPTVSVTSPAQGAVFATAPASATVAATASDDAGVTRVEFYANGSLIGTKISAPYQVVWSGVASGSYTLVARAFDADGASFNSPGVTVRVNAGPTASITAPASNSVFTAPASVSFTASASDGDGSVSSVQYVNQATGSAISGVLTTAPYTFTWSGMAAGSYTLVARAIDNNGVASTSAPVAVTINDRPVATLSASALNPVAPGSMTLQATASDSVGGVSSVRYYANGTAISGVLTSAPFTFNWTAVARGTYAIVARATDAHGATGDSATYNWTVNQAPSVSLTAPATGTVLAGPTASVSFSATASDVDGSISKVEFLANGSVVGSSTTAPYAYTWANAPAATHTLTARATDNAGVATTSAAVSIRVNALPTTSLTAPTAGTVLAGPTANISMSANAGDTDGSISKVEFVANGAVVGTSTTAPYSFTWVGVLAGTHSLVVRATDNNGGVTSSAPISVRVNAVPTTTLTAPSAGTVFAGPTSSIAMSATAGDADGSISKVEFVANGAVVGTSTAAPYSFTWVGVLAGTHSLVARATDNNGGVTSSAPISVRVNALPTATLTAPVAGTVLAGPTANVAMTATAADPDGSVAKVEFLANGSVVGTSTTAPYAYTWANAPQGTHSLVARATDNNGGVKSSTAISVRINAAPSITLTAPANGGVVHGPSATIALTANATDGDGSVSKVEFLSGSSVLATVTATPYQYNWTGVPVGTYALSARATDSNGAVTSTPPVSVRVNAPPVVALKGTLNFLVPDPPGWLLLEATASDPDGSVARVDYLVNGSLLGTGDPALEYRYSWTNIKTPGTYNVVARATDNDGLQTTSASSTLVVAENVLPVVSMTGPASGSTYDYPAEIPLRATATDSTGGIVSVWFQVCAQVSAGSCTSHYVSIGQGAAAGGDSYAFQWKNETPGTYLVQARATDAVNGVQESAPIAITIRESTPPSTPVILPGSVAGTLPGSVSVDPSGAANYNIPIALPPGTAGMVPSLSLGYSSRSGGGLLGHGWSLNGFSAITRCGLNRATDDPAKPYAAALGKANKTRVKLDASDQFCLDGQRLVLVSGTHGAAAEYRTEIDDFSKILSFGSDPAKGPDRWEVWDKGGRIVEYGGSADSRLEAAGRTPTVVMSWSSNRVRDRRQNYYTIHYGKDAARGDLYPQSMRYTGNASAQGGFSPYHAVRFVYDAGDRADPMEGYVMGSPVGSYKRLSKVQVVMDTATDGTGGLDVHELRVGYRTNPVNGRSLVDTLQDCARPQANASSAYECLPATTFEYTRRADADHHYNAPGSGHWGGPELRLTVEERTRSDKQMEARDRVGKNAAFADFNGDGLTDVASAFGEGAWNVCLSTGSSFDCRSWAAPGATADAVVGDYNGDGASDFLLHPPTETASGSWTLCLSTRSGFSCSSWAAPMGWSVAVVDLNADSRDDLLMRMPSSQRACLANGSGFTCTDQPGIDAAEAQWVYTNGRGCLDASNENGNDPFECWVTRDGSFDGTGRTGRFVSTYNVNYQTGAAHKLCQFSETGVTCTPVITALTEAIPAPGSMDGPKTAYLNEDGADGYADIVVPHLGKLTGGETCVSIYGVASCYLNRGPRQAQICSATGIGFNCRALPEPSHYLDYDFYSVADVDGDGRADGIGHRVCQLGKASTRCDDYAVGVQPAGSKGPSRYADFNGDGRIDVAMHDRSSDVWSVALAGGPVPDLLVKVTNGVGHVTTLGYDSLRNPSVYTPDSGAQYPLRDVQDGTLVVTDLRTDNGVGGHLRTTYRYGGAKADMLGRGFLGFRWFEATDHASTVVTRTEVSQSFPTVGMPTLVSARHSNGVEIQRTESRLASVLTLNGSNAPKAYFAYADRVKETFREMSTGGEVSVATSEPITYDAYGNLRVKTVTTQAGGETYVQSVDTQYLNDTANWLLGLPTLVTSTASGPTGTAGARTRQVEYTALGELKIDTVEPQGTAELKLAATVDRRAVTGVADKRTLAWTELSTSTPGWTEDGTARTRVAEHLVEFDARDRYATKVRNALNHEETRSYDARNGQLASVTGPNGLTTQWVYDGWGRRLRETRADGSYTTTSYSRCLGCGTATMTVTTQTFNAAGTAMATPVVKYMDVLGRDVRWQSWAFDGRERNAERTYDSNGRLATKTRTRFVGEAAVQTVYEHDTLGRLTKLTDPTTGVSTTAHAGLTITHTNSKSQTRTEVRNALGKLRSVTDADNRTTTYLYEPFGALVRVTDPLGNEVRVGYDRLGRKTSLRDPNLGTVSYRVNALGQTRSHTDAKNQTTRMRYDDLGRTIHRLGGDHSAKWVYDSAAKGVGQLAEAYTEVGTGTKDYQRLHAYDTLGRPDTTTVRLDNVDYVTRASYDTSGRLSRTAYTRRAAGTATGGRTHEVQHDYNAQGYLWRLSLVGGSALWTVNQQDALDRVERETAGNGIVTQRGWHAATGRLEALRAGSPLANGEPDGSVLNDSYLYDSLGNLTYRATPNGSGGLLQETFDYDNLNRLKSNQFGATTISVSYDALGNIKSKSGVGTYAYPAPGAASVRPHAVSSITGSVAGLVNPGFTYDDNGNLVSGLGRTASWTSFDMPLQISKSAGAGPGAAGSGAAVHDFVYGPELQRIRQDVVVSGGPYPGTTRYWYAGAMERETRSADNTTHVRVFLPQGAMLIDKYASASADVTTSPAQTQLRYTHRDRLGSTSAVSDEGRTVLERQYWDPWGKRRNGDGSASEALRSPDHRHGYTEHEMLDDVGLIHMNGRVYDPTLGRFMSADPTVPDAGDGQNYNRYSYVLNNPTVYTDPSGFAQVVREADGTSGGYGAAGGGLFGGSGGGASGDQLERGPLLEIPSYGKDLPPVDIRGGLPRRELDIEITLRTLAQDEMRRGMVRAMCADTASPAQCRVAANSYQYLRNQGGVVKAFRLLVSSTSLGTNWKQQGTAYQLLAQLYEELAEGNQTPGISVWMAGQIFHADVMAGDSLSTDAALRLGASAGFKIGMSGMTSVGGTPAAKGARALAEPVYKTTKEAKAAAEALGFKKINETVHDGQAVFKRGKDFITRDLDGHNGGAWKMADSVKNLGSKETRAGTFDVNLNRIGD